MWSLTVFNVFPADGRVLTVLDHKNEGTTPVDGFQEPGSFMQDIMYDADMDQIEALINRSSTCQQRLRYECKQSRLFNSPCMLSASFTCELNSSSKLYWLFVLTQIEYKI
jgi:hypothetical protein